MDYPDYEGSQQFQISERIYQSEGCHAPEDLNTNNATVITSNIALCFILLKYNIGLHVKNKTKLKNYR
jgi:hypothetical protein